MEQLLAYISAHAATQLEPREKQIIEHTMMAQEYPARSIFAAPGKQCRQIGFIMSGAVRQYVTNKQGREYTIIIHTKSQWTGDHINFLAATPCRYYFEVLENTELLVWHWHHREKLLSVPAFKESFSNAQIKNARQVEEHLLRTVTMDTEARVRDLMERESTILQRFSSKVLASYLHMTPETFYRTKCRLDRRQQNKGLDTSAVATAQG